MELHVHTFIACKVRNSEARQTVMPTIYKASLKLMLSFSRSQGTGYLIINRTLHSCPVYKENTASRFPVYFPV